MENTRKQEAHNVDEKKIQDQVCDVWFGHTYHHLNYKHIWFCKAQSIEQSRIDAYLYTHFQSVLKAVERGDFDHWQGTRRGCLALILLLDQFSRHIYRYSQSLCDQNLVDGPDHRHSIAQNDIKALALSKIFCAAQWQKQCPIPEFVFALMPFRHNQADRARLELVLDEIQHRQAQDEAERNLLLKFQSTTERRLDDLVTSVSTNNNACQEADHDILEVPERKTDESNLSNDTLVRAMRAFLREHFHVSTHNQSAAVFVSLSGGVDSMVVAKILVHLTQSVAEYRHVSVVAIHIDYGNRDESAQECAYVRKWCARHGIECHVRRIDEVTRGQTKREDYEVIARDIRYSFYSQVLAQKQARESWGICFGHHRGDVQENVIANAMKGLSLLSLNGMSPTSQVNGVTIWRPFLDFDKTSLVDFAQTYGVPYFKDTTPAWSTRGKLRTHLLPLLREIFGSGVLSNVSGLGTESEACASLVKTQVLLPLWRVIRESRVAVCIPCGDFVHQSLFFWKETLRHVCHDLLGTSMIRDKPVQEFRHKLGQRAIPRGRYGGQWLTLKRDNLAFLTCDRELILFRTSFFRPDPEMYLGVRETHLPLNTDIQMGHWSVMIRTTDDDDDEGEGRETETEDDASPKKTLEDILTCGGLVYRLPLAPAYGLKWHDRIRALRSIEKKVTDVMPLVSCLGSFDSTTTRQCVTVELKFQDPSHLRRKKRNV